MDDDIWGEYFTWLCDQITSPHTPSPKKYKHVLWKMHNTVFIPRIKFDENRVEDAYSHRLIFSHQPIYHDIGVFEMMVSLSSRIERETMSGTVEWDRTADWFWEMMRSLGLLKMTDENYDQKQVETILSRFMQRRYSSNGTGGLFTVLDSRVDMRQRDIWRQAAAHLNEILRDEGVLE